MEYSHITLTQGLIVVDMWMYGLGQSTFVILPSMALVANADDININSAIVNIVATLLIMQQSLFPSINR